MCVCVHACMYDMYDVCVYEIEILVPNLDVLEAKTALSPQGCSGGLCSLLRICL